MTRSDPHMHCSHRCHTAIHLTDFDERCILVLIEIEASPTSLLAAAPSQDCGSGAAQDASIAAMSAAARKRRTETMSITTKLRYWRTYRRTVTELQGMTDRQLSDLGIGRSEINRIARQAAAA